jgi:beta-lactamase regulating signal transducer with metallopeptidase domain
MSSEAIIRCEAVLSLAATYWLYSTVLLSAVWLWMNLRPTASHLLQERLWKFAATAGFVTATLQATAGLGVPLLNARDAKPREDAPSEAMASHSTASLETADGMELSVEDSLLLVRESLGRLQNVELSGPAELTRPSGQLPGFHDTPLVHAETEATAQNSIVDATADRPALSADFENRSAAIEHSTGNRTSAFPDQDAARIVQWLVTAVSLLGVVSGLGLLWFSAEWLLFLRSTRKLQPASWQQLKLLDELRQQLGIRQHIELLTSDRFTEPVAFGLWRWKVVLPANLDSRLSESELTSLLAHEIAHLARGDVLWLHIGRLLTSVFAWQPLNFLARRQWQLQVEFASDDWAISRSVDPVSLARCLTIVAEWRSERRLGAVALPAGGSRSHITDRVERLLAPRSTDVWSTGRRRTLLALVFLMATGSLAVAGPSFSRRESQQPVRAVTTGNDEQRSPSTTSVSKADSERNVSDDAESQLKSESALLALEISLLADELAALEKQLASVQTAPAVQESVDRLTSRLAMLRSVGTTIDRPVTTSKNH